MAETETEPWYADGLSFTCTQCGNCCTGPPGYVWFSDEEAKQIAEHLGISEREFRKRYAKKKFGKWSLGEVKRNGQYDCVFLTRDEQGKAWCSIYPVRPTQCQTWPFWPENLASPEAWEKAAETCPGMRTGKDYYPPEQIRIIRDQNPK